MSAKEEQCNAPREKSTQNTSSLYFSFFTRWRIQKVLSRSPHSVPEVLLKLIAVSFLQRDIYPVLCQKSEVDVDGS